MKVFTADAIRSKEELEWAAKRLKEELNFSKEVAGQYIAYVRDIEGYRIFGDPRWKGALAFRIYKVETHSAQPKRKAEDCIG
jgi:hypothetical protein